MQQTIKYNLIKHITNQITKKTQTLTIKHTNQLINNYNKHNNNPNKNLIKQYNKQIYINLNYNEYQQITYKQLKETINELLNNMEIEDLTFIINHCIKK